MPIRIARCGSEGETETEAEPRRRSEVESVVSPRSYEMSSEELRGNRKAKEICLVLARETWKTRETSEELGRVAGARARREKLFAESFSLPLTVKSVTQ